MCISEIPCLVITHECTYTNFCMYLGVVLSIAVTHVHMDQRTKEELMHIQVGDHLRKRGDANVILL